MLISSERFNNAPVMSLQTGGQLAHAESAIINPNNLQIIAYKLGGHQLTEQPSFLLIEDVRELSNLGFIVDSSDEFVGLDDVIKVQEIYELHFELIGKKVLDQKKHHLGKVSGYSVEPDGFYIKQLNVKRPLLKSFSDTEILIDRSQITEITDTTVTIRHDEREPSPVKRATDAYTNPFRGQTPQTEAIDHRQR